MRPTLHPRLCLLFTLLLPFTAAAQTLPPATSVPQPEGWDAGLALPQV
jgi:hypothetical protein